LDDPDNFRGITLNSSVSKLFTLLLNERLSDFCDSKGLISDNQIGFRKGSRTSDHIFTLKTLIDQSFANKKKLYVCFVDFKKAYDTVWRNGLFLKLLRNKVSVNFVNLLTDMYSRLQASVNLPNGLSMPFKSLVGLKQGCNLSPLLFNLFINDIMEMMQSTSCDAPSLELMKIPCLLYADDLILISETKAGLQESLNTLNKFTKQWFLEINPKKTKCLTFSKGRVSNAMKWVLGSNPLDVCNSYCYLGVLFNRSGSMKSASQALHDKALGAMFSIIRNVNKHNSCNINLLFELFDKLVTPIALYNSEVWGTNFIPQNANNNNIFNESHISKIAIEGLQFKFLIIILKLPQRTSNWAVTSETGRFPLALKVFKSMIKYLIHAVSSPNKVLSAALSTNAKLAKNGHNSWFKYILRLLKICNLEYLLYTCDTKEINYQLNRLNSNLRGLFLTQWNQDLQRFHLNSKLDFFSNFKNDFTMTPYLQIIRNPTHRSAIAKIRMSAHKFPIEMGRYLNIPREEICCPFGCNALGDEQHYLLHCSHPFIREDRTPLLNKLSLFHPEFDQLDNKGKCNFLLNNTEPHLLGIIGKLCNIIQETFREITF
jgi:hypothetical protein